MSVLSRMNGLVLAVHFHDDTEKNQARCPATPALNHHRFDRQTAHHRRPPTDQRDGLDAVDADAHVVVGSVLEWQQLAAGPTAARAEGGVAARGAGRAARERHHEHGAAALRRDHRARGASAVHAGLAGADEQEAQQQDGQAAAIHVRRVRPPVRHGVEPVAPPAEPRRGAAPRVRALRQGVPQPGRARHARPHAPAAARVPALRQAVRAALDPAMPPGRALGPAAVRVRALRPLVLRPQQPAQAHRGPARQGRGRGGHDVPGVRQALRAALLPQQAPRRRGPLRRHLLEITA